MDDEMDICHPEICPSCKSALHPEDQVFVWTIKGNLEFVHAGACQDAMGKSLEIELGAP